MTTATPPCPRCGIPGVQIDGDIYKCWLCVVTIGAGAIDGDDACRCDCSTCQGCDYAEEDDGREVARAALRDVLPWGWALPEIPKDAAPMMIAVLYCADGTDLTALAEARAEAAVA